MSTDRKLTEFGGGVIKPVNDPNPAADRAGVSPDRDAATQRHQDETPDCNECGASHIEYKDASVLNADLPSVPLCRPCIINFL